MEWNGVSLVDRSFEEVCTIMDRTGDTLDLVVEHATDFRMSDIMDEATAAAAAAGAAGPLATATTSSAVASTSGRKSTEDPSSTLAIGESIQIKY